MLWRRTVEEGNGMLPASFTTVPATLLGADFAESDEGKRACAAHDETARSPARVMSAGFILVSSGKSARLRNIAEYRITRLRKAAAAALQKNIGYAA
jgi:hypothetical protein